MKKDIFEQEIIVPKIVKQKAEIAFSQIKKNEKAIYIPSTKNTGENKKRRYTWKGIATSFVAVAATAAIIIVSVMYPGIGGEDSVFSNSFVLKVNAAELEAGKEIPVVTEGLGTTYYLGVGENENSISYCMNIPLTCEGDNIESICYSINQGAFQIIEPRDSSIIISGTKYAGNMNVGRIYDGELEDEKEYQTNYYTSYMVEYERQDNENVWINVCGEKVVTEEVYNMFWSKDANEETYKKGLNELVKDIAITCTVNYEDGTCDAVQIIFEAKISTYGQIGIDAGTRVNEEYVFIVCKLK